MRLRYWFLLLFGIVTIIGGERALYYCHTDYRLSRHVNIRKDKLGTIVNFKITRSEVGVSGKDIAVLNTLQHIPDLDLSFSHLFIGRKINKNALSKLGDMKNLRGIYLCLSNINDEELKHIRNLNGLSILDLSYTAISNEGLHTIKCLDNLVCLDLSQTGIKENGLATIKSLENLKVLKLRRIQMSELGLTHLASFKQIACLDLSESNLSDLELRFLTSHVNLQILYLEDNKKITNDVFEYLKKMPRLKRVYLKNTAVTQDAANVFEINNPSVSIDLFTSHNAPWEWVRSLNAELK